MGLTVSEAGSKVEEYMWMIWKDADSEMKCNIPFDPFKILMDNDEMMGRLNNVSTTRV